MDYVKIEKTLREAASGHPSYFASRIYDFDDLPNRIASALPFQQLIDMQGPAPRYIAIFHDSSPDSDLISAIDAVSSKKIKHLEVGGLSFGYLFLNEQLGAPPAGKGFERNL